MKKYVRRDGLVLRIGSVAWRRYVRHHLYRKVVVHLLPKKKPANQKLAAIVAEALKLVGIHEVPMGSNSGRAVHTIQAATGALNAAWCVSTVQFIWKKVLGSTWAEKTANAYFLADYAKQHKATIQHPVPGCVVVYHMGDGHAGTVVKVNRNGTFWAVEGNWGDAVVHILRDPRTIPCTFILRPELR